MGESSEVVKERGIIQSVRGEEGFGFITADERRSDLYFRCDDFDESVISARPGDRVEFEVFKNERTGQFNAKAIFVIPHEKQPSRRDDRREYREDRGDHRGGRRDRNGRGNQLELVSDRREQGFVRTVRDSFGFISRVDGGEDLFYHVTECDKTPVMNEEVEFAVARNPSTGKLNALQVTVLPKGTIPPIESRSARGRIRGGRDQVREPRENGVVEAIKGQYGFIVVEGEDKSVFFHTSEVTNMDPSEVNPGDKVEFSVYSSKPNGKKNAKRVRVTEKGPGRYIDNARDMELANAPREQGIIRRVKDNFGFIERATPEVEDELFFHVSEIRDGKGDEAGRGTEVEYVVISNDQTQKKNAIDILILEKGTVNMPERKPVEPKRHNGTIESLKGTHGTIKCEDFEKAVFFRMTDVDGSTDALKEGVAVEFAVKNVSRRTGDVHAKEVCSADVAYFKNLLKKQGAAEVAKSSQPLFVPDRQPIGPADSSRPAFKIGRSGEKEEKVEESDSPATDEAGVDSEKAPQIEGADGSA